MNLKSSKAAIGHDNAIRIKNEAYQTLVRLGFLIPANSRTLYHGRSDSPDKAKEWKVLSSFSNANNETERQNLNRVNGLSTTPDKEVATEYAVVEYRRQRINNGKTNHNAYLYKIYAESDDLFIINNFDFELKNLSVAEQDDFVLAIQNLTKSKITKLAPVRFEERGNLQEVTNIVTAKYRESNKYLTAEDVIEISKQHPEISRELFIKLVGDLNARRMLLTDPGRAVRSFCFRENWDNRLQEEDSFAITINGEKSPFNFDYIAGWLSENRIIGISQNVGGNSRAINNTFLFDLEKVNTKEEIESKFQKKNNLYNGINKRLKSLSADNELNKFLEEATPEELIDFCYEDELFKQLFDNSAGVWERFSIGQHTETTLRVFENSYKSEIVKSLSPFVKMALICHDIGKGEAVELGDKSLIDELTQKRSREVCDLFKIPKDKQEVLLFVIGEAQKYTSDYFIKKDKLALQTLKQRCSEVLEQSFNSKSTNDEISGLISICKIVQNCDSGAYTRYGVTRDENNMYHYNGNDRFTKSFEKPTNLTKNTQHMIEPV